MSRVNRYEYQDWKNFGPRVRNNREKVGMTREKFAESISRSESFVAELEKGRASCSIHTLHQISQLLKVSTDELMYGEMDNMKEKYSNKEILLEIIERCNDEELDVIKDLIVAVFPNFKYIMKKKQDDKN